MRNAAGRPVFDQLEVGHPEEERKTVPMYGGTIVPYSNEPVLLAS